jgi:hypothetical protein
MRRPILAKGRNFSAYQYHAPNITSNPPRTVSAHFRRYLSRDPGGLRGQTEPRVGETNR